LAAPSRASLVADVLRYDFGRTSGRRHAAARAAQKGAVAAAIGNKLVVTTGRPT
jgi:hypothetical protein